MSQILARFRILLEGGKEILYTSDLNVIEKLRIKSDDENGFPDLHVIGKGTILNFVEGPFEVTRMYSFYYNKTHQLDDNIGVNLFGQGENHPFNYEVTLYIKPV